MEKGKKLIYAEDFISSLRDDPLINGANFKRVVQHINDATAVDAVEVVRCKDCKMEYGCRVAQWLGENGFCSYGERKE